jgi:hypothetical protein
MILLTTDVFILIVVVFAVMFTVAHKQVVDALPGVTTTVKLARGTTLV